MQISKHTTAMTITDLNSLLRDKCPSVFITRRLSDFYGKRIAIDTNNWMFKFMSVAHKQIVNSTDIAVEEPDRGAIVKLWLSKCLDAICTLVAYGITPVFVFDGQHPDKKTQTKLERREKKEAVHQEVMRLKGELNKIDILARKGKQVEELVEELRKYLRQCIYVSKAEEELLKMILNGLGIPMLQATGEAEQLCCMLAIEGKVEAVFSEDTDNLAYGCPLLITEFTDHGREPDGNYYHQVKTVGISDVLTGLGMLYPMFVDLCIMLGCDYNSNIKQVGSTRAYNLIKKFGGIMNLPLLPGTSILDRTACKCGLPETYKGEKLPYDLQILECEFCLMQFSYQSSQNLIIWDMTVTTNATARNYTQLMTIRNTLAETARDVLNQADMLRYIQKLVQLYKMLPPPPPVSQDTAPVRYPENIVILKVNKPAAKTPPRLVVVNDPVAKPPPRLVIAAEPVTP